MAYIEDHGEDARRKGEVVHSGHFMISSVADDQEETENVILDRDSPIDHERSMMLKHGYDFSHVEMETQRTYQFGPLQTNQVTIDASLSRLFQCMSLAYQGGKVVSPKWKNFKGLKLTVKDKIRLNNAIWRQWHIQYIIRKKKGQSLIQFATPFEIDFNTHSRPEAVVLEGKYWKRRIETVVAEYKKWRAFFLNKYVQDGDGSPSEERNETEPMKVQDDFTSEFSDSLFTNLPQQPFQFPNPREIAQHMTNSDMIQPGLIQLQPGFIDDYMDFDPFQDLILNSPKKACGSSNTTEISPSIDVFADNALNNPILSQTPTAEQTPPNPSAVMNAQTGGATIQYQLPNKNIENSSYQRPAITVEPVVTMVNFPAVPPPQLPVSVQQIFNQRLPLAANQVRLELTNQNQPSVKSMSQSLLQQQLVQNNANYFSQNKSVVQPQSNQNQTSSVISYFPEASITSRNVGNHSNYFTSKKTNNVSVDNVIYTQTQTVPSHSTFPHDQTYVTASHSKPRAPLCEDATPSSHPQVKVVPPTPDQARDGTNQVISVQPDMFSTGNNAITSVYGNPSQSRFQVPVAAPVQPGLRNNQRKRGCEVDNRASSSAPVPTFQRTNRVIAPTPSSHPPTSTIPEKRRSIDEGRVTISLPEQQTLPQSSLVRHSLSDIDMEQAILEPVSPSLQDSDALQMEIPQKQFSTEKKRRLNINVAFNHLQKCLSASSTQTNTKISKASLMNKAAQYIKSLQTERNKMNEELQTLKQEVDKLQSAINNTQMQLPATGTSLPLSRVGANQNKFNAWCRRRTTENWKFFLFGKVIQPWFDSYQRTVTLSGSREFVRTLSVWLQEHCSLRVLRPNIVKPLQVLCTSTSILTDPTKVKEQIEEAVREENGHTTFG